MTSEENITAEFKARMIERHRPAFDLWRRCHELLETAIPQGRDVSLPFPRALDILLIQAFKSHGSLYFLCVHGHGEDGATILRRMLEIAFQVRYLCNDPAEREERAQRYLAWFWLQAQKRLQSGLPQPQQVWWQTQYDAHKHLILGPSGAPMRNWWGDSTIPLLPTVRTLRDLLRSIAQACCNPSTCDNIRRN
jgi:hypothetical protein